MTYTPPSRLAIAAFLPSLLLSLPTTDAADWPTYRGDSHRSGYTAVTLPAKLSLRWVYKARHVPHPAWSGRDTRMPFDWAYHTTIADRTVFFGSSADGKVYALDAATGVERWTFFTGGPVRFAPAAWRSRVFVVSDDGFLYCLTASEGKLLWKIRGGPIDSMLLGNGRMISRWPARGGPVVADGVVYFAAGIWPSEGIFVHAIDGATGKRLWCNDTAGSMYLLQPHGTNARSGVSVQGNLVIADGRLLAPTGRAVPAAFRRTDGKFLYFHLSQYGGGGETVAAGSHFFNSRKVFEAASGRGVETMPRVETSTIAVTPRYIVHGHAAKNEIFGIDRDNLWTRKETVDRKGAREVKTVLSAPAWQMGCPHKVSSLIAAGSTVVVGGARRVSVLDVRSGRTLLTAPVDGEPYGLAAADGRLFVSTDRGAVHCFDGNASGEPRTIESQPAASPYGANSVFAAAAEEIVRRTGVTQGYCLDLACGDGGLAYALATRTELHVCAMDLDPAKVALARRRLDRAGLYGVRVTVRQGDPAEAGYPNYFANLVVSGRSVIEGPAVVPSAEVNRVLRPYGGAACIGRPEAMSMTVRGKLDGAGAWTHQYCNAANTNCSTDTLLRGPLGMLWFTDSDLHAPSRHGRGPAPLCHKGRLFVEGVDALRCVDAYSGRTVWEYPLPGILKAYDQEHIVGTAGTGSNFCVTDDGVYVRTGGRCLRIDPVTGRLLAELKAPALPHSTSSGPADPLPPVWGAIACVDGTLFGTLADPEHVVKWNWKTYGKSDMRALLTESTLFFALDAKTGALKWTYRPEHSVRHNTIAIGCGRVYLIDRPMAMGDRLQPRGDRRRGKEVPKHPTGALLSLNAADGKLVWKSSEDVYGTMLALSEKHDALLMAYQHNYYHRLESEVGGRMAAFRASDGKRLWDLRSGYHSRHILNDRTIYALHGAWDLLTGKSTGFFFRRNYGCGTYSSSRYLMAYRSGTLGYTDLLHNHGVENYGGLRPGCWINAIPAGGLLLMPEASEKCGCSYLMKASIALQPYGIRPPTISPDGGSYHKPVTVSVSADAKDVDVRYTLDGRVPTRSSERYVGPIEVSKSATLKARGFREGLPPSHAEASFAVDPNIILPDDPAWKVHDLPSDHPSKCRWRAANGVATVLSHSGVGDHLNPDPAIERPGSFRVYASGSKFGDGELSLDIASTASFHTLGVAFRFSGLDQHYLWAMNQWNGLHVIACKNGDTYRALASNRNGYQTNVWHKLRIVLDGPTITVYLNGEKDLAARDETFSSGTFALYNWRCRGARFRNVKFSATFGDGR